MPFANNLLLRSPATFFLPVFILLTFSTAWAGCEESVICVNEERIGDQVLLRVENLSAFPVTFTLRVRARSLTASGPQTVTQTLKAHASHRIMTPGNARKGLDGKLRYHLDWTIGNLHPVHDDHFVYRLPFESGKSYRVIQGYGAHFSHTGLEQFATDFRMEEGTPVHAARGGIVARIEEANSLGCWRAGCAAHANFVVILHEDGTTGEYYHLQQNGALVDVGERIVAGQRIALSGNTGHTALPHLHFAVYRAVEHGSTQSIAVRFATADGTIERTRSGDRYQATALHQEGKSRLSGSARSASTAHQGNSQTW